MKSKHKQNNQALVSVFSALAIIAVVWLLVLTSFAIWSWNIHIWQAENDANAMFNQSVRITEQQIQIEELQNKH